MDEESRDDTDDQIEEDYSPSPETQAPPDTSGLAFATFVDPRTSGMPGIESMAKLEPSLFQQGPISAHCRIAMMQHPSQNGQYIWTFAPRAKGPGQEPTEWPCVVNIDGFVLIHSCCWRLADLIASSARIIKHLKMNGTCTNAIQNTNAISLHQGHPLWLGVQNHLPMQQPMTLVVKAPSKELARTHHLTSMKARARGKRQQLASK